jgi:glycosyltransferase involved in cell wall biosynthesis
VIRRRAAEIADASVPREPILSVCMVTYNHERFIAQAIDSVLMQRTDFAYELVIGDDCSTDDTRRIVLDYQRRHPDKIRVLLQPRNTRGHGNCTETYGACRGKYLAELEGDDYWIDPEKLQLQVQLLEANPQAFICGARAHVWKDGEDAPSHTAPWQDSATLAPYGARELFEGAWWFRTCTKVFPRRLLHRVPPRFNRDWAGTLWLIAKTDFAPVCFLDRVVGVYRQHAGGSWSSLAQHGRLASDVTVLCGLMPVFSGPDRDRLKEWVRSYVGELVALDDAPALTRMRCAYLAVRRNPNDPMAWRHLLVALRLANARPSR